MAEPIVFYHWPMSRGRMVHWMLEETGAPYRIEVVNLEKGEHKLPAFLAINPMGKLPTITYGGTTVSETGAIITFLADAFPAARLAPALDDPARGAYLRWMFFCAACVDPAFIDRMLERPVPERAGAMGYGRYEHVLDTLEAALKPGPFLLGDRFTSADLYLASQLGFGLMTKTLEPRPAFSEYLARVTSRPAHQRALDQGAAIVAKAKSA